MLLHDASPGYHAAPTHRLPFLPQYGTLEQGGEGKRFISLIPGEYSHLEPMSQGDGEVLIMFTPNP